MAKPAATISHFHVCPKKTGKIPHVGGPVIQDSPDVFIGGLPAAAVPPQSPQDLLIVNEQVSA